MGERYISRASPELDANTKAVIGINNMQQQDWYGVAKLHAECRHRSLAPLPIVDIRVFNYFSHRQDMDARFLITDILRAIRDKAVLQTSSDYIVRDYLRPSDFYQLVSVMLAAPATNTALDCYSKAPIDKPTLLEAMRREYGLRYETACSNAGFNATGYKSYYLSINQSVALLGYRPMLTSIEGVFMESKKILHPCRS